MALNAPIQGTAADLIKLAMVEAQKRILAEYRGTEVRLVLQVHDEIIYEVEEKLVQEFSKKLNGIMEKVLEESYMEYDSPVPLIVHSSSGKHWGELK